tara:strand:+ start:164 stop:319 length:156 start_codon:yes stop_codon:yes gene_type:complete
VSVPLFLGYREAEKAVDGAFLLPLLGRHKKRRVEEEKSNYGRVKVLAESKK